ncbi:MAG: S8 family peptidase [Rubrivivax sp.]
MSALFSAALATVATASLATAAQARGLDNFRIFEQVRETEPTSDRLIVRYRDGRSSVTTARQSAALQVAGNRQGVRLQHHRQTAGGAQVLQLNRRLAVDELQTLAANLQASDPDIEYAEPDRILRALGTPNDALFAQQWALTDATGGVRAPTAWDRSTGAGVVVAVIDTGVRPHADLKANLLAGYDFVTSTRQSNDGNGRDADASDPGDGVAAGFCGSGSPAAKSSWHGTHVAGIVGAVGGNATGVAGVAYGAKVLPVRALGRCGGYSSDIADAIVWSAGGSVAGVPVNATPAKVINLSLGGTGACDNTTQNAVNAARAKGAVVVVAAGNSNTNANTATPANCAGVITVAATNKAGGKASYSNTGSNVALAAPGGDGSGGILSTLNSGTQAPGADSYASYMGTSMAAPVVSGVAALVMAANPKLTPDQVATVLKTSTRAFPATCNGCGNGLVDANAAVLKALGVTAPAPAPTPAPTPAPAPAPVPSPLSVAEVEPNNTVAQAQVLATAVRTVTGTVKVGDNDHSRVTLPAKGTLTVRLSGLSNAALGLAVMNTAGQTLAVTTGAAGGTRQIVVNNAGSAPVALVVRVYQSSGAPGAYTLNLAY